MVKSGVNLKILMPLKEILLVIKYYRLVFGSQMMSDSPFSKCAQAVTSQLAYQFAVNFFFEFQFVVENCDLYFLCCFLYIVLFIGISRISKSHEKTEAKTGLNRAK